MIDLAPTTHYCAETTDAEVIVHELAPDERLRLYWPLGTCEYSITVADGVLYTVLGDDEYALMPGDEIAVHGADLQSAWNAGAEPARVITTRRTRPF